MSSATEPCEQGGLEGDEEHRGESPSYGNL